MSFPFTSLGEIGSSGIILPVRVQPLGKRIFEHSLPPEPLVLLLLGLRLNQSRSVNIQLLLPDDAAIKMGPPIVADDPAEVRLEELRIRLSLLLVLASE